MDITAERLEPPRPKTDWRSILIGAAPLAAVTALFMFNTDLLIPEPSVEVEPIYYPPVAVVFVSTTSAMRDVRFDARVMAERRIALRSETPSRVVSVSTRVGRKVSAGDAVCRLQPGAGDPVVLFSPIDGVVGSVNGSPGTKLQAGQPCLTIIDPESMIATAEMSGREAAVIAPGDSARVTTNKGSDDSRVRVVYPDTDDNPDNERPFEVAMTEKVAVPPGSRAVITIATEQVLPTLVPTRALTFLPGQGMAVRMVSGSGPTGRIRTVPVRLVAASKHGLYVDGLPSEARLVVEHPGYEVPEDGETVRIGRVG